MTKQTADSHFRNADTIEDHGVDDAGADLDDSNWNGICPKSPIDQNDTNWPETCQDLLEDSAKTTLTSPSTTEKTGYALRNATGPGIFRGLSVVVDTLACGWLSTSSFDGIKVICFDQGWVIGVQNVPKRRDNVNA